MPLLFLIHIKIYMLSTLQWSVVFMYCFLFLKLNILVFLQKRFCPAKNTKKILFNFFLFDLHYNNSTNFRPVANHTSAWSFDCCRQIFIQDRGVAIQYWLYLPHYSTRQGGLQYWLYLPHYSTRQGVCNIDCTCPITPQMTDFCLTWVSCDSVRCN